MLTQLNASCSETARSQRRFHDFAASSSDWLWEAYDAICRKAPPNRTPHLPGPRQLQLPDCQAAATALRPANRCLTRVAQSSR